ncbi:MAG: PilN domain-containing protein [Deltaproteobacteria bacterium]|nr:PilN domain-containing protein [Deltaproteobacteria bacterium]
MIQINLLPVREWRKKEAVRQQISIFVLSLILLIVGLLATGLTIQGKVRAQKQELASLEEKKAKFVYVNKKIEKVNKKRKQVEDKFKAIEELQEGRTSTVKILDEIVSSIPIDRLWLTKLNLKGNNVQLGGVALDNHTVALFMRRLETSPMCKSVNLINTRQKSIQGHALMEFGLQLNIQAQQKNDNDKKFSKRAKKS